jgi:putative phosphoribosyl transferase
MRNAYFSDRTHAGQALASALDIYSGRDDVVLLALPRGGVPVAHEVALRLEAPLDVIVVRKIGAPGHQELAMGAVASGGVVVRNQQVIEAMGVDDETFANMAERMRREVRDRDVLFRGGRSPLGVTGKVVIVIDDGIATGSTITAALRAVKQLEPDSLVVAVPVASAEAVDSLAPLADKVLSLETPSPFISVSSWYDSFPQLPDKEVRRLLREAH